MNRISTRHADHMARMVISAGRYCGASWGRNVWGPMMLPTQYAITGSFRSQHLESEYKGSKLRKIHTVHGCHRGLLGVSSDIGGDEREKGNEGRRAGLR